MDICLYIHIHRIIYIEAKGKEHRVIKPKNMFCQDHLETAVVFTTLSQYFIKIRNFPISGNFGVDLTPNGMQLFRMRALPFP